MSAISFYKEFCFVAILSTFFKVCLSMICHQPYLTFTQFRKTNPCTQLRIHANSSSTFIQHWVDLYHSNAHILKTLSYHPFFNTPREGLCHVREFGPITTAHQIGVYLAGVMQSTPFSRIQVPLCQLFTGILLHFIRVSSTAAAELPSSDPAITYFVHPVFLIESIVQSLSCVKHLGVVLLLSVIFLSEKCSLFQNAACSVLIVSLCVFLVQWEPMYSVFPLALISLILTRSFRDDSKRWNRVLSWLLLIPVTTSAIVGLHEMGRITVDFTPSVLPYFYLFQLLDIQYRSIYVFLIVSLPLIYTVGLAARPTELSSRSQTRIVPLMAGVHMLAVLHSVSGISLPTLFFAILLLQASDQEVHSKLSDMSAYSILFLCSSLLCHLYLQAWLIPRSTNATALFYVTLFVLGWSFLYLSEFLKRSLEANRSATKDGEYLTNIFFYLQAWLFLFYV